MHGRYKLPRDGIPTGLVGHSLKIHAYSSEVIDLNDLEAVVKLLVAFARSLPQGRAISLEIKTPPYI